MRSMNASGMAVLMALAVLLFSSTVSGAINPEHAKVPPVGHDKYKYTWKEALYIPCKDNATLRADAFVPTPTAPGQKFPVVIFPNSWGCPQIEYITRALGLAERGYVAMEYETRGWFSSGGFIDVAGPLDRHDGSTMIDFVASKAAEWNADMSKVAFMGISYGAGISLEMAGHDARVTTSVALSGWNNLTDMLYGNESPNTRAGYELYHSAQKLGHISDELGKLLEDLKEHKNIHHQEEWNYQRSPEAHLAEINRRNVPLFMSNNYMDNFFRPQYMLGFYGRVTTPKMLLLNQGPHAFPEGMGVVLHDNYIWSHALRWLDHWLKNDTNGIMDEPKIQVQKGNSIADQTYVPFSTVAKSTMSLGMTARNGAQFGGLANANSSVHTGAQESPVFFAKDVAFKQADYGKEALMATGLPYMVKLAQPTNTSVVYVSDAMASDVTVCGTPTVDLHLNASHNHWQVYTFLYDVDPDIVSEGSLWTHGFFTYYPDGPSAGPVAQPQADGSYVVHGAELHTICKDLKAGHKLALAIALYDDQFTPANGDASLSVRIVYDGVSALNLPLVE